MVHSRAAPRTTLGRIKQITNQLIMTTARTHRFFEALRLSLITRSRVEQPRCNRALR